MVHCSFGLTRFRNTSKKTLLVFVNIFLNSLMSFHSTSTLCACICTRNSQKKEFRTLWLSSIDWLLLIYFFFRTFKINFIQLQFLIKFLSLDHTHYLTFRLTLTHWRPFCRQPRCNFFSHNRQPRAVCAWEKWCFQFEMIMTT